MGETEDVINLRFLWCVQFMWNQLSNNADCDFAFYKVVIRTMASEFSVGSIPPFYRQVYEIVCPNQEQIQHDIFVNLMIKTGLAKSTLSQIWDLSDTKSGYLTRTSWFKALALIALAQQGKSLNDKVLETYTDKELPKPSLGDLSELRELSIKLKREADPTLLGYTYQELCDLDSIKIDVIPERKGLIMKHVEYSISSRKFKATVKRRYNDFLAFQELLILRFPYRMIPRLPPKQSLVHSDDEFLEARRRSLARFLKLLVRHPVIYNDEIVQYFLTFQGSDTQNKIKEHFKGLPDEFMTNENALKAKELVSADAASHFHYSKAHMSSLVGSISVIRQIIDNQVHRLKNYAADMIILGKELSSISQSQHQVSSWACGISTNWQQLQAGLKPVCVEFKPLGETAASYGSSEEEGVLEELNTFLDLLLAYQDMCERQERNVASDHQRALSRITRSKKKQVSAAFHGDSAYNAMEQRILQQENELQNLELRIAFSLYSMQMETQLVHAHLEAVLVALNILASEEHRVSQELSFMWAKILSLVDGVLGHDFNKNARMGSIHRKSLPNT